MLDKFTKSSTGPAQFGKHNGWLYFLDKNYFLEESDYLNGKLPCEN